MKYFVKSLAALIFVFAFFEGTVRLLGLGEYRPGWREDPAIGWTVVAGSHLRWGSEGYGRTLYVADGEVATPHDQSPEILVPGDSHTEALQVDDPDK